MNARLLVLIGVGWITAGVVVAYFFGSAARLGGPQDPRALLGPRARRVAKVAALLAGVALVVGLLGGCATPGRITTAPLWAPKLTLAERVEADRIETAVTNLCDWIVRGAHGPCYPPTIMVIEGLTHDSYTPVGNNGHITLSRGVLGPHAAFYRPAVGHELGHRFWIDAQTDCARHPLDCEDAANFHAIEVLVVGFGYTEHDAALAVWRWLAVSVVTRVKPSVGHPSACRELWAFEDRVGITPHYACTP